MRRVHVQVGLRLAITAGVRWCHPTPRSASHATTNPSPVPAARGEATAEYKRGDWYCTACRAHNFRSRSACYRCSAPRGSPSEASGRDNQPNATNHGDWRCPCGETNFRRRPTCYFCDAPAPTSEPTSALGGAPSTLLPVPWSCAACGIANLGDRVTCFVCDMPRPALVRPPGVAAGHWWCPRCGTVSTESRSCCRSCDAPRRSLD